MGRSRTKTAAATAEAPAIETGPDVFDEQIAAREQTNAPIVQDGSTARANSPESEDRRTQPAKSHAAAVGKKNTPRPVDPFDFESVKAGANKVQLLKSEGEGAWVIRFAHNPNDDLGPNGETYSKDNPHPVLTMLKKEEGYRWGFDGGDGKGGWGKAFAGDPYGADHIEARRVFKKAAEMIGAPVKEQSRIPD